MAGMFQKISKGIYKRGDYSYQVKMMVGGVSMIETFNTLAEAEAWRDTKRVAKALDPDFKKVVAARVKKRDAAALTLGIALDRYLLEVTPAKKGAKVEAYRIGKLKRYDIANQSLYAITPEVVDALLNTLEKEGLTENSRRKYAAMISHLFKIALKRWRLAVTNPIPGIELPSNGKPRARRLEDGEEDRLIQAMCDESPNLAAFVQVALETASRRGELLALEWKDVKVENDGTGSAVLHDTKNGETRVIPLSSVAVNSILTLPCPIKGGKVFGLTVQQVRTGWERVRKVAGCPDLRFHDLRHEGVSRLFELGLDRVEAASVSGHKTLQMLRNYTHLKANRLAAKIDRLKTSG